MSGPRVKPLPLAVIAASLALLGWLLTPVTTARAGVAQQYMQINICGNICYDGSDTAGQDIANSAYGHHADIVSINEVCGNQLTAAKNALAAKGLTYQAIFGQTIAAGASVLDSRCQGYGNGLLIRYTASSAPADSAERILLPDFGEDRMLLCAHIVSPSFRYCVTHLTSGSSSTNEQNRNSQAIAVANKVNSYLPTPVVLAGDFNTTPGSYVLDHIYGPYYTGGNGIGHFREVDACSSRTSQTSTCNEGTEYAPFTTDPKIDYIFTTDTNFTISDGDATSSVTSDHDPLFGSVIRNF
ncbi:endonuclease/exonuclease/phosphatase family protein [Jatrophihabitans sp.]|jgi:endonuclease/exonuclease/phosphatase family metal-dependent hydrolase|uniref:endonuclease/exonuclease/phosphatase family protein n=1 Tax=Jatrophihabitans sp. TaxID=1932789 RepID=UPI002F0CD868